MKKKENENTGVTTGEVSDDTTSENRFKSEEMEYEVDASDVTSDDLTYETLDTYKVPPESHMGGFIMDFSDGSVSVLLTTSLYEDDDALMEIFDEHPVAQNTMLALCGLKAVLCDPIYAGDPMVRVALEKLMEVGHEFQIDDTADERMISAEPGFKPTLH